MKNRRWIVGGTSAIVAAGLAGGAVLASVSNATASAGGAGAAHVVSAGSASGASLLADDPTSTTVAGATGATGSTPAAAPGPGKGRIDDVIDKLASDGVITTDQATKIKDAIKAARPAGAPHDGRGGPGGFGGFGPGRGGFGGFIGDGLQVVADTIGITTDQLRTELMAGTSIKAVAEAHGKTAQNVIDALTKAAKDRFDKQVTAGTITQAQADDFLAKATTAITDMVNNTRPAFGDGRGPGGHRGGWGPNGPAPSGSSTPSTTTN